MTDSLQAAARAAGAARRLGSGRPFLTSASLAVSPLPTGDLEAAARVADAARRLDLADRYLNCLAVKALFRAGHVSVRGPGEAGRAGAHL